MARLAPAKVDSNPCSTKRLRMFSTVFVRQSNASAICASVQLGPVLSAFKRIWARRTFWLLPESRFITSRSWLLSDGLSVTRYLLRMKLHSTLSQLSPISTILPILIFSYDAALAVFLAKQIAAQTTVYVAINRTTWHETNLLVASVVWRGRAIPLYWQLMETLGNSDYTEQTALLSKALPMSSYPIVVLGDREFCSVDLAQWLGEQGHYSHVRSQSASTPALCDRSGWVQRDLLKVRTEYSSPTFLSELTENNG